MHKWKKCSMLIYIYNLCTCTCIRVDIYSNLPQSSILKYSHFLKKKICCLDFTPQYANRHVFNTDCCKNFKNTLVHTYLPATPWKTWNLSHNQLTSIYVAEGQTSHVSDGISKSQSDNIGHQRYFSPLLWTWNGSKMLVCSIVFTLWE